MTSNNLDQNYWDKRWINGETGWDIGYASKPICEYMRQYDNKSAKILIPGCGNAWEAEFLLSLGFKNIHLLDISPAACEVLQLRYKNNDQIKIHCGDFFKLQENFDLILEQTFFCAIDPGYRNLYVEKAYQLLNPGGKLVGLLFATEFDKEGPPFGGSLEEYNQLFSSKFKIRTLEYCINSITPRDGNELFVILEK